MYGQLSIILETSKLICIANQLIDFYYDRDIDLNLIDLSLFCSDSIQNQQTFTSSKTIIKTLEKSVKYVQSYEPREILEDKTILRKM